MSIVSMIIDSGVYLVIFASMSLIEDRKIYIVGGRQETLSLRF